VTRDAAPGRACLRVGPLNAGSLVAWWPDRIRGAVGLPGGRPTASGTLMASDVRARDSRVLEIADVIFDAGGAARAGPAEWLSRTLGRYPGCAVAAVWHRHGECTVATRGGSFRALSLHGRQDASVCAFACAVFVHGWLAARLPLACLQPACLEIGDSNPFALSGTGTMGATLLNFRFCYADSSGALGAGDPAGAATSDSSSRTDSASGAPSCR